MDFYEKLKMDKRKEHEMQDLLFSFFCLLACQHVHNPYRE